MPADLQVYSGNGIAGITGRSDDIIHVRGQCLSEKRQALVHPVIDTGMVVGKLLVAMRNAELVQPSREPTSQVSNVTGSRIPRS
jgi:hypothetical protein